MEENKSTLNIIEENLELGDNNKINLKIMNDKLKIQITYNEKDYLGIFSLKYFQDFDDDYDIFSSIVE